MTSAMTATSGMSNYSFDPDRWCFESKQSCLDSLGKLAFGTQKEVLHCNGTWDGFLCWPAAVAGTTSWLPCPPLPRGIDKSKFGFRNCGLDGSWEGATDLNPDGWTNYTDCITKEAKDYRDIYGAVEANPLLRAIAHRTRWLKMIGLTASLLTLTISLFIFFYFRGLRCDRIRLHRNLFLAIFIHAAVQLVVFVDQQIAMSSTHVKAAPCVGHVNKGPSIYATPGLCESLMVIVEFTRTAMFHWMLIEGFHLHNTLVISVFSSKPNYIAFYIVGWGVPVIPVACWAITNILVNKENCWYLYQMSVYHWILEGPRLVIIITNLIFLLNIIREIVVKLRIHNSSEAFQVWKATRATLILLPLLGANNFLAMIKYQPTADRPIGFALWSITAYFFSSFQGVFVSFFYCFINADTKSAIAGRWRRRRLSSGYGLKFKERARSTTLMETHLSRESRFECVVDGSD